MVESLGFIVGSYQKKYNFFFLGCIICSTQAASLYHPVWGIMYTTYVFLSSRGELMISFLCFWPVCNVHILWQGVRFLSIWQWPLTVGKSKYRLDRISWNSGISKHDCTILVRTQGITCSAQQEGNLILPNSCYIRITDVRKHIQDKCILIRVPRI